MYGFIQPTIGKKDWVAGSGKATKKFGGDVNPSGDWTSYNPNREHQNKNGLETMNCSNFGTHNALIALAKFYGYDFPSDASERYSGVMTGTSREGNDPNKVIEEIRTLAGVLPDARLPWTNESSWDAYYAPVPMDENLVKEAQKVLRRLTIGHEWVFFGDRNPQHKADLLKRYLKRGTICVSVDAWNKKGKVYSKEVGAPCNHWVWLVRYDGENPVIRDQYPPFEKTLDKDYDFGCAKVYFMTPNPSNALPHEIEYLKYLLRTGQFAEVIPWIARNLSR